MIKRHLTTVLQNSLRHFPAALLIGARQVGKSTLAQSLAGKKWPARYLTLDDRTVLDAALVNPDGLLQGFTGPLILDEVQRAPDLLRAVKLVVDRDRRPGRFLLTGSANVLTLAKVSEKLAGRAAVHELLPLSWTELHDQPGPRVLEKIFSSRNAAQALRRLPLNSSADRVKEIKALLVSGGYPTPALMKPGPARRTWFDSYRQTYVERDLRDLTQLEHLPDFNRLLATLAFRTGSLLNLAELSREVGLPYATLTRYFHLLAQTFQVFLVPPFSLNIGKRLVKTPKVYFTDTGLACHLSFADSYQTLEAQNRAGAMVETWAANELRKIIAQSPWPTSLWHYRDQSGREVDFLLERGQEVVGLEVKLSAGFHPRDLAGLQSCRQALKKKWRMGVLLHAGTEALAHDDQTLVLPFGVFFGRDRKSS